MTLDKLKLDMFRTNKEKSCFRLLFLFAEKFNLRMSDLYPPEYGIPSFLRRHITSLLCSVIEERKGKKAKPKLIEPCCNAQAMHADGTTDDVGHLVLAVLSAEAGALAVMKNSYESIDNVSKFSDDNFPAFEKEWETLDDSIKQSFGAPLDTDEELKAICWNLVYRQHGPKSKDWEYLVPELLSWEAIFLFRNEYHCGARYPNPILRITVNYEHFFCIQSI
jgi:hypothetical protein